jgi:hypothetical protein
MLARGGKCTDIYSAAPAVDAGRDQLSVFPRPGAQGDHMIFSVFVRRLKPGAAFEDFVREREGRWEIRRSDQSFNAQSFIGPREVVSTGFVAVGPDHLTRSR